MWFIATLVDGNVKKEEGKEQEARKELQTVLNTDNIKMLVENNEDPETTMVVFVDNTAPALIKGSFEKNAKVMAGFNRR